MQNNHSLWSTTLFNSEFHLSIHSEPYAYLYLKVHLNAKQYRHCNRLHTFNIAMLFHFGIIGSKSQISSQRPTWAQFSICGKNSFRVPYYTFWICQPHLLVHVIADLSPCINREGNPRLTINGRKQGNDESFETSGCSSALIHCRCFYLCRLAGHNDEIYSVSTFFYLLQCHTWKLEW